MNNLSIKKKLIIAFSTIATVILLSTIYNNYGISKSSDGFTSYRTMAKNSLLASNIQTNMLMVRINVKNYLTNPSQKEIDEFNIYYNKTNASIKKALKEITNPLRAKLIKTVSKDIKVYKDSFFEVVNYVTKRKEVFKVINKKEKEIEDILISVKKNIENKNELQLAIKAGETIQLFYSVRLFTAKFLKSNSNEDSIQIRKKLLELEQRIEEVEDLLEDDDIIDRLEEVISFGIKYGKSVNEIISSINSRNDIINNKLNKIGPRIGRKAEDIKISIKNEQAKIGLFVKELNDDIYSKTLIVAVIVLLLVVFFAISIPTLIIKGLNSLNSGILNLLNTNDVSSRVDVVSNDEIGKIADNFNKYLESIEDGLNKDIKVIDDVKRVVSLVKEGKLNQEVVVLSENKNLDELRILFNEMLKELTLNISKDINRIEVALEKYSKLDFTFRIDKGTGKVEKGLNSLADTINNMLIENKSNGLTINKSSEGLLKNVEILSIASSETAASLEETAAALEEVTSNISSNTENIVKMSSFANKLSISSNDGKKLANETTDSMEEINVQVNAINDAIIVIDQIAFQTNILSLNAAVEAATAGESGKGFAVVAQEVRNLAARSAQAASEIKTLVENATLKADNGKIISKKMINGYENLNENISRTIELITDVESASKEQKVGIEQINSAINMLDVQTQKNASVAGETKEIAMASKSIAKLIVDSANEKEFIGKEDV